MMDDEDIDEDLRILEALEAIPEQSKTDLERKHKERRKWGRRGKKAFLEGDRGGGQEAFIDLYNRLAAEYGTAITDLMLEEEISPFVVIARLSQIWDDLDLWFGLTGQRVGNLREVERIGLEVWLWEIEGRRQAAGRYKPKKSPKHDIPWVPGWKMDWGLRQRIGSNRTSRFPASGLPAWGWGLQRRFWSSVAAENENPPPAKWAPRRWFALRIWSQSKNPLQISVSRALNRERAAARAELATEVAAEQFHRTKSREWENTSTEPVAERNHPKPQGFWSVKRNAWSDCRWEPCEDEAPPQSVLDQRHEGPPKPVIRWIPLPPRVRLQYRRHCSLIPAEPVLHLPSHEGRPGAWSQRYVEAPAGELAAHRAECRRRREAAIDGLLSNAAVAARTSPMTRLGRVGEDGANKSKARCAVSKSRRRAEGADGAVATDFPS